MELFHVTSRSATTTSTSTLPVGIQQDNSKQTDNTRALALPTKQATATGTQCPSPCPTESLQVANLTDVCMRATHMDSSLLSQARTNARYLFDQYRRVVPRNSLGNIHSHCWRESFSIQWGNSQYSGKIRNVSLHRELELSPIYNGLRLSWVTHRFHKNNYDSDTVCLPNLLVTGFPKCGSSYFYCFVNKLLSQALYGSVEKAANINIFKEPHFWALANAAIMKRVPTVNDIGIYLLNFLPGARLLSDRGEPGGMLVDGTPNSVFNWPRFRENEHDLTNYCILPSVVPTLLPNSKYIVIIRNPIKMLYSSFWFSCTGMGFKLSNELKLRGPDIFHERTVTKLDMFNDCMKDASTPSISSACKLEDKHMYASCIQQRLHLLDKCTHKITFNLHSPELRNCGRSRVSMAMYYVHIRKWLSVLPRDRLLVIVLEELIQDFQQAAHKVLTFLDLDTSAASSESTVNRIAHSCNENSQTTIDYKHNPKLQMRSDTLTLLERFFFPFDSLLAELVDKDLMSLWYK